MTKYSPGKTSFMPEKTPKPGVFAGPIVKISLNPFKSNLGFIRGYSKSVSILEAKIKVLSYCV